jgi:hypothetical protein
MALRVIEGGMAATSCRIELFLPHPVEFIIPTFIEGSTCFERHTAHHQEL